MLLRSKMDNRCIYFSFINDWTYYMYNYATYVNVSLELMMSRISYRICKVQYVASLVAWNRKYLWKTFEEGLLKNVASGYHDFCSNFKVSITCTLCIKREIANVVISELLTIIAKIQKFPYFPQYLPHRHEMIHTHSRHPRKDH